MKINSVLDVLIDNLLEIGDKKTASKIVLIKKAVSVQTNQGQSGAANQNNISTAWNYMIKAGQEIFSLMVEVALKPTFSNSIPILQAFNLWLQQNSSQANQATATDAKKRLLAIITQVQKDCRQRLYAEPRPNQNQITLLTNISQQCTQFIRWAGTTNPAQSAAPRWNTKLNKESVKELQMLLGIGGAAFDGKFGMNTLNTLKKYIKLNANLANNYNNWNDQTLAWAIQQINALKQRGQQQQPAQQQQQPAQQQQQAPVLTNDLLPPGFDTE